MSPDQVSIGVLVDAVPRDAVDEAVAVCGVRERRSDGKLPAHVSAYLTLGLSLFPDDDYEEVAAKVTGSLDRFGCWDASWSVPTASAITQARKRLGREVFSELFERTCGPVAGDTSPTAGLTALGTARGSFLRGWRLVAIDGFELDMPDTPANAAEFGYAGSGENRSAFPKARVVALCECGTHAFLAAEIGPIGGKGAEVNNICVTNDRQMRPHHRIPPCYRLRRIRHSTTVTPTTSKNEVNPSRALRAFATQRPARGGLPWPLGGRRPRSRKLPAQGTPPPGTGRWAEPLPVTPARRR